MKVNQVEELNIKLAALLSEYGVEGNYLLSYVLIDEDDHQIQVPTIANVTEIPASGVSKARASGFLCEVLVDSMLTMLRSYNGLDVFSGAGALKGMVDETRGTQLMQRQMQQAQQSDIPEA